MPQQEQYDYNYFKRHGHEERGSLYLIRLSGNQEDFYKVGISKAVHEENLLFKRIRHIESVGYKAELLFFRPATLYESFNIEQSLLDIFGDFKYTPHLVFSGGSECLSCNPLELCIRPNFLSLRAREYLGEWEKSKSPLIIAVRGENFFSEELGRGYRAIDQFKVINSLVATIPIKSPKDLILVDLSSLEDYFLEAIKKSLPSLKESVYEAIKTGTEQAEKKFQEEHGDELKKLEKELSTGVVIFKEKFLRDLNIQIEVDVESTKHQIGILEKIRTLEYRLKFVDKYQAAIQLIEEVEKNGFSKRYH